MVGESHVCAPVFDVEIRCRFNYCGVAVLAFSYLALPALIVGWHGRLSSKSVWMATLIVFFKRFVEVANGWWRTPEDKMLDTSACWFVTSISDRDSARARVSWSFGSLC